MGSNPQSATAPEGPQLEKWLITKENFVQWTRTLESKDRRLFKECKPARVQLEIQQLQKDHTSSVGRCVNKLQPFLSGVERLDGVISPIASLEPHGIGNILWASVKVCLDLAKTYAEFFEKIGSFLSTIGGSLERLQVLQGLYEPEEHLAPQFMDALGNVFAQYLCFFRFTKDYLESSHIRKARETFHLVKTSKKDLVTLSMELLEASCDNARAWAEVAHQQLDASVNREQTTAMSRIQQKIDAVGQELAQFRIEQQHQAQKSTFDAYLGWLKHIDMTKRVQDLLTPAKNVKLDGAESWIFTDRLVRDWIVTNEASSRILWLSGDAGFGKSTLAACIVAQLPHLPTPNLTMWQPSGSAYFFCTHRDNDTRTINAILRSWIFQLLQKPRIGNLRASVGHLTMPESEYGFSANDSLDCEYLCDIMRQLYDQGKPTRLVVDGLDECKEPLEGTSEADDWDLFFELLRDAPDDWSILIVSRPRTWYRKRLGDILGDVVVERAITSADNSDNICTFIKEKLKSLATDNGWSERATQKAFEVLSDNAHGQFMYVSLFCNRELAGKDGAREEEIMVALHHPPQGLDGIYRRNLEDLDNLNEDTARDFRRALKWILCSSRPLRVQELMAGLRMTPTPARTAELEQRLGSFVKLVPTSNGSNEVQVVHASAREYLLSPQAHLFGHVDTSDQAMLVPIHAEMLTRCLVYLKNVAQDFVHVDTDRRASEGRMRSRLEDEPFLEYSCIYWVQHLVELFKKPDALGVVEPTLDGFFTDDTAVLRWLQMFHFLYQFNYAGSNVSRSLIGNLTYRDPTPDSWQDFVHKRYKHFVRHLGWADGGRFTRWDRYMHVRKDVNPHVFPEKWWQSPTCFAAPCVAAFFDYKRALEQMIETGVDKDHRGPLNGTPLLWAATADACETLAFLLDAGAKKDVGYHSSGETAIFRAIRIPPGVACRPGRYPCALLLHKRGAKLKIYPDVLNWIDRTVLIVVLEDAFDCDGAVELIKAILPDDPARTRGYVTTGSLLHSAAWLSRPRMLQALLEDDVVRKRKNEQQRDRRPLHDACSSNNPNVVQKLLDVGADANARSSLNHFAALHYAVHSGGKTIPVLLGAGAIPTLAGHNGSTAFHLAAEDNVMIDFKLMIEKGHAIDLPNGSGMTALALSLEHANLEIATKLLDLGADPAKVPESVLLQQAFYGLDHRLQNRKKQAWQACWSFELCWMLRCYTRQRTFTGPLWTKSTLWQNPGPAWTQRQRDLQKSQDLPYPIIARILSFANVTEVLRVRRTNKVTVDASLTERGGDTQPYCMSPPVFGGATRPVQRILMRVFSCCQNFGGQHDYSYSEAKKVDGKTKACVKWQPEKRFGHNAYPPSKEKRLELRVGGSKQDREHLQRFQRGDRAAIVQHAHCPGWTNTTEWASIEVEICVVRDKLIRSERDLIWKHNRGSRGVCRAGLCPRCAVVRPTSS